MIAGAVVLLLAAVARLAVLDSCPPGWRDDELIEVNMDSRIAAGWRPLYIEEAEGHEPLYHYAHAVTIAWFGPGRLSYRWLGAACGLLTVALTMALGRRLFGRRAALWAGAAMAVSFWPLMYSRLGLRHIGTLPALLLAVYALWQGTRQAPAARARQTRRSAALWFTLAGVGLAAGLYTYFAGRVAPFIVLAFAIYLAAFHRDVFGRRWAGLAWSGVVMTILFAPLGWYLAHRPLEARLEIVGRPLLELRQGNLRPALETTLRTLGMFTWRGDPEWLYNISGRPALGWIAGAFFYLGVAVAARRWKRAEYGLLLIWLVGGLAPAFVSLPAASFGHAIAALPAVYLLLGLGLAEAGRRLARLEPFPGARHLRRAWPGPRLSLALGVLVLGLHGGMAARDYAVGWSQHRYIRFLYHADVADVARYLNDHPDIQDVAIATTAEELELDARGLSLDLTRSRARARLFDPRHALVLPGGSGARVAIISDPLPAPHVEALLARQATWTDEGPPTVNGPAFRLYAARPIAPAASPAVSLPVTFEGRLSLIEFEVESLGAGGPAARVRTTWRVESPVGLPAGLKLFAHLLTAGGDLIAVGDRLDVWLPALGPGDQFVQWNDLSATSLSPGRYGVAVGLYEPDGRRWKIDSTGGERVLIELVIK